MTPEQRAVVIEAMARAIQKSMFAPHELPLSDTLHYRFLETATAALDAALAAAEAAGFVLVPVSPTDTMVDAGWDAAPHTASPVDCWIAMVGERPR